MTVKTFTTLGHLQNYAESSEKAHGELKSCLWQLTKSRRNVRSGIIGVDSKTAYTAALLREDLRAQIRVIDDNGDDNGEIELVDEDTTVLPPAKGKDRGSKAVPQWKIYNVLAEIEKATKKAASEESSSSESNEKKAAAATISDSLDTSPTSSWTMVQESDLDSEEEEKIIRTDPLKLFGGYFTALELKVAQRNAQQSLNSYVQAANEAAKILELLREDKD